MPKYTQSHRDDDEDDNCPEIVGSSDLREAFKEKGRLRGSFSINGHMLSQFETNSIENLIAQLNAKSGSTFVDASIDDGYHLVLEAHSPAPIVIALGPPYTDPPARGGDTATDVVNKLKSEAEQHGRRDENDRNRNTILEDLGLEATEQDAEKGTLAPGTPPPGMSAEDRKKAREERQSRPEAGAIQGQTAELPTNPTSPIGSPGGPAGEIAGTQRSGQGAGYSAKPDGTPPVPGTPAGRVQPNAPADAQQPVQRHPDHQSS